MESDEKDCVDADTDDDRERDGVSSLIIPGIFTPKSPVSKRQSVRQ